MTCRFEEESKACGRQVGMWAPSMGNDHRERTENADYSLNHVILKPNICSLGQFDASKLITMLGNGERTLHFRGDSTMRQMFHALLCSIPDKLMIHDDNYMTSARKFVIKKRSCMFLL